ncbi:hypothetical protein [Pedobacter sp. KBS0701]|uniref:hypothetical protein n=1 Tax=unclassified Pedobacter TaxID=2628915 RepID=UPI00110E839F|nr:hypothetical protein [Pedobacter sp. KBS0701]QDW24173.1 hypothetical protein FFJ24_004775 [Pedobacter sp. KBS0701]
MNAHEPPYKICGKVYSKIQLLKLAGVQGIHPKLDRSSRITLDIDRLSIGEEEEAALLTITSVLIVTLQVYIFPKLGIVKNDFIVLKSPGSKLAFPWVNRQVSYTRKYRYNGIECWAKREDEYHFKVDSGIIKCPIIGYMIWMKFGYLMKPGAQPALRELLLGEGKNADLSILELIKDDFGFWKEKGYGWPGYFDLAPGSDSAKILKKYYLERKN